MNINDGFKYLLGGMPFVYNKINIKINYDKKIVFYLAEGQTIWHQKK